MTVFAFLTCAASLTILSSLIPSTCAVYIHESYTSRSYPNLTATSIEWTACPPGSGKPDILQCATFPVPIDWDQPYGEHFNLGLVKLPMIPSNSTSKVGSLLVNPGGPGGRASDFVVGIAEGKVEVPTLRKTFDIIGLDPRGAGLSHQVKCDMSIYAERVSLFPQNDEDFKRLVDKNRRLGESCRKLTGPLFEHLDTISSAKDHEAVRIALGNQPLNYIGISYGSYLGAQYAELFPNNIRTLVIDGVIQHSQSESTNLFIQAVSFEQALTHFFEWARTDDTSVLKGQDVKAIWKDLIAAATEIPIPAPSCNGTNCRIDVTAEEIRFNSHGFMTYAGKDRGIFSSWEQLSSALYHAKQGNATALSTSVSNLKLISQLSIGCLDWTRTAKSVSDVLPQETLVTTYAPLTHGSSPLWTFQHACLGWPVGVKNPPRKLDVKTNTTILVVGSTSDPSTGLSWVLGMLEEIENKVLMLRDGEGHTSFIVGGEAAMIEAEYLITGIAPKAGIVTHS